MTSDPRFVPPPRPLKTKKGKGQSYGCLRIFILPHLLVGIVILALVLFQLSLVLFGETVNGTVTGSSSTSDDEGVSYVLDYTYRYEFTTYAGQSSVTQGMYENAAPGDIVRVRVHPLAPGWWSEIEDGGGPGEELAFMGVFALFWNGILSVFIWMAYVIPIRQRRLVAYGTVADGRILSKKHQGGTKGTRTVRYRFHPTGTAVTASGTPIEAEMTVDAADYQSAQEGAHVTVIYSAAGPSRSIIYDYAPWEIRSP